MTETRLCGTCRWWRAYGDGTGLCDRIEECSEDADDVAQMACITHSGGTAPAFNTRADFGCALHEGRPLDA